MLTKEQIEKNKKFFIQTNEKYKIFLPELVNFLGDDFFVAPASPRIDMFGCYPGGLVDHLIKVCKYTVHLNELLPEAIRNDKATIIKVSFLSQIGKTFLFKMNDSEWHCKTLGKMYEYKDEKELTAMTVGERSIFYATKYGTQLTDDEYQAIINSDKPNSESFIRWNAKPLSHILQLGFEMAILEERNGKTKD